MKQPSFQDLIIFENDDYFVINKPPHLSTLDDRTANSQNILRLAKAHDPEAQVAHRLDKETSGALAIARNPEAYRHLLPGAGGFELIQSSPYKMHQRCAEAFHKGRVLLAGDAAHVTNPTGGFGLTTGLFDAFALWPTLAAVILEGADPALLDTWADERRAIFLDKTSPMACTYKDFVFHACGGPGEKLEAALDGMRRMVRDPDYRLERLMFTKGLETTSPAER